MAWRLAKSLTQLSNEIRAKHPGTTIWSLGDAAHRASASDHNPNSAGVVCAIDVVGDKGLNLGAFAEHIKNSGHPAVKYVIFNRRIWSKSRNSEGWRYYGGSNPHATHVHVSVGVGPDGRSTGPYDNMTGWGISKVGGGSTTGGVNPLIGLKKGDKGEAVKALQYLLRQAGFDAGTADGDYGNNTAAAVLKMRKSRGSTAKDGNEITGAAYEQLMVSLIKNQAPKSTPPKEAPVATKDLPKFGDEGTEVEKYQRLLEAQGVKLTRNRKYDAGMQAAVSKWFKDTYGEDYDGSAITAWIALELEKAVLKGEKGDQGEPGKDGELKGELKIQGIVEAKAPEAE